MASSTTSNENINAEPFDLEMEQHENLYMNIYCLTIKHPTTKDFQSVFREDMFTRNNKTAFQHVIHFLLNVYDPAKFRESVCWPILDNKMEVQFRNEVMKFINDMKETHTECWIPKITTSHLISPGGSKFVDFMFHLSSFILYIEAEREGAHCLIRPETRDDLYPHQVRNLELVSNSTSVNILRENEEYKNHLENMKKVEEKENIREVTLMKSLSEFEKKLSEAKDYATNVLNDETYIETEKGKIEESMKQIEKICKGIEETAKFVNYLAEDKKVAVNEEIDLLQFLKDFRELVELKNNLFESSQLGVFKNVSDLMKLFHTNVTQVLSRTKDLLRKTNRDFEEFSSTLTDPVDSSSENHPDLTDKVNQIFKTPDIFNTSEATL